MIALAITLAVLVALALLPLGVRCRYDGEALVQLLIGPLRLQLVPAREKPEKQRKPAAKAREKKENKQKKPEKPEQSKSFREKLEGILPFVQLAISLFGGVWRKLYLSKLQIHITLAGQDPAKVAMDNGRAWAVIGATQPLLCSSFRFRKADIQVTPDFVGSVPKVYAELILRMHMGDLIVLGIQYGWKALKLLFRRKKQEKAVQQ